MPLAAGLMVALSWSAMAAQAALTHISSDPFTNPTSNHRTEVEPDTFSFDSTVVSTLQLGRFFDCGLIPIRLGSLTETRGVLLSTGLTLLTLLRSQMPI